MFDAMDRVLRTDELVREIFEYLDPYSHYVKEGLGSRDGKVCRGSLFNAALCCRSFSAPALDVLWRYQEHFLYLLTLLPFIYRSKPPPEVTFSQPLDEDDWTTFAKYAKRVRTLNVQSFYHSTIDPECLYEALFRIPRLCKIHFDLDLSPSIVKRLSALTNLRELNFNSDRVDWGEDKQVEFRQLQIAGVQGKVPSINSALRLLSFPHIHKLRLEIESLRSNDPPVSGNFTLIDADLSKFFPSLRSLIIRADHLAFTTIRPILTLRHIQEIQFGPLEESDKLDLEDEDVCEMARAWPTLTSFVICVSNFIVVHRNCLLEVARCCPRLQYLKLPDLWFDAAPDTDNLSPSRLKMKGVRLTCFCPSASDEPGLLKFVQILFPVSLDEGPEIHLGPD